MKGNSWGGHVLETKRRKCFREDSDQLCQILLTDRGRWGWEVTGGLAVWKVTPGSDKGSYVREIMVKAWFKCFQKKGRWGIGNIEHRHWFQRILLKGMRTEMVFEDGNEVEGIWFCLVFWSCFVFCF